MALFLWAERATGAVEGSLEPAAIMEPPPQHRETCGHAGATAALQPPTAGVRKAKGMYKATRVHGHWRASSRAQALHAQMSPCAGLAWPVVPACGWTHAATSMALTTHSETQAHTLSLSLPLWCQTLKGKNFDYLKGPPVQCLFFSFFFLMCFGNGPISCTPSLYVPQVRKQTKKGINQPK